MSTPAATVTTATSKFSSITSFFKDNLTIVIIGLCISLLFIAIFLLIKKINVQFNHYDSVIQMVNNNIDTLNKRVNDIKFGTIEDIVDKSEPEVDLPNLKPVETKTQDLKQSKQAKNDKDTVKQSSKVCKTAEPKVQKTTQVKKSKVDTQELSKEVVITSSMSHVNQDNNDDKTESKNEDSIVCFDTNDIQDTTSTPQFTEFIVMG